MVQHEAKPSSNAMPLTTSKLANQLSARNSPKVSDHFVGDYFMDSILTSVQKMSNENSPVDQLLARITQQQEVLSRQKQKLGENDEEDGSSSATDPYANTPPTESVANSDGRPDAAEVFRLKKELELASERMAQMELELTQSRITKHTVEEAIGSPFPAAQHLAFNIGGPNMLPPQNGFQGRASPLHPVRQPTHGPPGAGLRIDTGVPAGMDAFTPQQ